MAITINNSANITYRYGDSIDSAISNVASTELTENYSLNAIKTSLNNNWRTGENLTFVIRIENDGTEPLFGIVIQDNFGGTTDKLLTYVDGSARMFKGGNLVNIVPNATNPFTLTIPDTLEAGEVAMLSYVAKVNSNISVTVSEITNEATVVGHEVSATGPAVTVTPNPSITIPKADYAMVRIEKTVDKANISVGEELTYTFRLENSGNIEATNVVIEDNLPEKFVINSVTSMTNGVETVFETTDYSLDAANKLLLPTSVTKTISVPASTSAGVGVTVVTIIGTITD